MVAPKIAALHAHDRRDELGTLEGATTAVVAFAAAPVAGVLVAFPEAVPSVFGADSVSGGAMLKMLALEQYVNVATGSVGILPKMCGHARTMRSIMALSALGMLVLCLLPIPPHGALGAAIAVAIAVAIVLATQNLIAACAVWRHLGIRPLVVAGTRRP